MRVHLYSVCRNEARILGFFFRHYLPWVDRFVIYDDGSDDDSNQIITSHPNTEVRRFLRTTPDSFDLSARQLLNNCWKESRGKADWVVVTDIDEHLYHSDIKKYLLSCRSKGITVIPALGYQMITDEFPAADEHLASTRMKGAQFSIMNKLGIFNPDLVKETNFAVGRHEAEPIGLIKLPKQDELLLLHYKYLGFDYLIERNFSLREGRGATDVQKGFGHHYFWDEEKYRERWKFFESKLVNIALLGPEAWINYREPKWWRKSRKPRPWWKRLRDLFALVLPYIRGRSSRL